MADTFVGSPNNGWGYTAEVARRRMGLGDAATKNVGTTAGTVAAGDDARLSDARTPTAHAASHATAGSDPISPGDIGAATSAQGALADSAVQFGDLATVAVTGDYDDLAGKPTLGGAASLNVGTTAGTVAAGDDSRLSDARTPTAHTHPAADISDASSDGQDLITAADYSAMRTLLGLSTSDSPQFAGINLGHASDTTLTRFAAGVLAVEGVNALLSNDRLLLTRDTTKTADFTCVVGKLTPVDLSGASADITATWPASLSEGDEWGVYIAATHASYELVHGRNSHTFRGGTSVTTIPIWMPGEFIIFKYLNSTVTILHDGRIPCLTQIMQDSAQTLSHNTDTVLTMDSTTFDNCGQAVLASDRIVMRRAGICLIGVRATIDAAGDQHRVTTFVYVNGTGVDLATVYVSYGATSALRALAMTMRSLAAGDYVEVAASWSYVGGSGTIATRVTNERDKSRVWVLEILQ